MIDVRELIPKSTYNYCQSIGIDPLIVIDSRIIATYKQIKLSFPNCYVNNWHKGGDFEQSGYRNDDALIKKCPLTQHRFGRAIDIHGVNPQVLYKFIISRPKIFSTITTIEDLNDTKTWLHIDVRTGSQSFKIVNG